MWFLEKGGSGMNEIRTGRLADIALPGTEAHVQYAGIWFPSYLAGVTTIGEAGPDAGNMDHALDVAGFYFFCY